MKTKKTFLLFLSLLFISSLSLVGCSGEKVNVDNNFITKATEEVNSNLSTLKDGQKEKSINLYANYLNVSEKLLSIAKKEGLSPERQDSLTSIGSAASAIRDGFNQSLSKNFIHSIRFDSNDTSKSSELLIISLPVEEAENNKMIEDMFKTFNSKIDIDKLNADIKKASLSSNLKIENESKGLKFHISTTHDGNNITVSAKKPFKL